MGLLADLFRITPPTLKQGYCPKTWQEVVNLMANSRVTFLIQSGNFLYNYGSATPVAENRIYPWLNTDDGLWWTFQYGLWVSPRPVCEQDQNIRIMWRPVAGTTLATLYSKDGGDGSDPAVTPPTQTTGSFWDVDTEFNGRFPIGVGDIPGVTPVVTVALGNTGGAYQHALTEAEGAVGIHSHAFGITNPGNDDAYFRVLSVNTVPNYTGYYITGSNGNHTDPQVTADLFTLPSGLDGKGVPTPTAFQIMPPWAACYWIKPTSRIYYTRPA